MPEHERGSRALLLRACKKLPCKVVRVEANTHGADPEAVEDREQQQWIVGRLPQPFSLFDQQSRSLGRRFGFRRTPQRIGLFAERFERLGIILLISRCDLTLELV